MGRIGDGDTRRQGSLGEKETTMATLVAVSIAVIAAIMVLVLIFLIPVLLQVRRTAKEAEATGNGVTALPKAA